MKTIKKITGNLLFTFLPFFILGSLFTNIKIETESSSSGNSFIKNEDISTLQTSRLLFRVVNQSISCLQDYGQRGKLYKIDLTISPMQDIKVMSIMSTDVVYPQTSLPTNTLAANTNTIISLQVVTPSPMGSLINLKFNISPVPGSLSFLQTVEIPVPQCIICSCPTNPRIKPISGVTINYNIGTATSTRVNCDRMETYQIPIGGMFDIKADVNCSDVSCAKNVQAVISKKNASGSYVYYTSLNVNTTTNNALFNFNSGLPAGTYMVELVVYCGGQRCPYVCAFILNANIECLGCWRWGVCQFLDDQNNVIAIFDNNTSITDIERGIQYNINAMYACRGRNCPTTYQWTITPPPGCGSPITGSQTVPNLTRINIPFFPACVGEYIISIRPFCGNTNCQGDITIRVKVKEACRCLNYAKNELLCKASGKLIELPFVCDGIVQGPVPRNGTIMVNFGVQCPEECTQNYSWQVTHQNGSIITPVNTDPLNFPGGNHPARFIFAANEIGIYTIIINGSCGMGECRPCTLRVKVEDMPCVTLDLSADKTEICSSEGSELTLNGFTGNETDIRWYMSNDGAQQPSENPNNLITGNSGNPFTGTTYNTGNLITNGCGETFFYYQCVTSNPACTSDVQMVKVYPKIEDIFITSDKGFEVCTNTEITLSASTSNTSQEDCQCDIKWYKGRNYTSGYSLHLPRTVLTSNCPGLFKDYTYDVVFCEGKCNEKRKSVNIRVYSNPVAGEIRAEREIICPLDATTLYLEEYCGSDIQWQISDNPSGPFADIPGATHSELNTNRMETTKYYQAIVKNGPCQMPAVSNTISVMVINPTATVSILNPVCGNVYCADITLRANISGITINNDNYFEWWKSETGSDIQLGMRNQQDITVSEPGTYYIKLYNKEVEYNNNDYSCDTVMAGISISGSNVNVTTEQCPCLPGEIEFTATSNWNSTFCPNIKCAWYINNVLQTAESVTGFNSTVSLNVNRGDIVKAIITVYDSNNNPICSDENEVEVVGCPDCN